MGILALVGFLIGVVLSYLCGDQLRRFGAEMYVVDLLGIACVRELGPLLAAILVAGRSGSSMTAQLGVMRLNEELDALTTIGVPYTQRLILAKVVALALSQPLVGLWTSAIALLGGMVAAHLSLGVGYYYFLDAVPQGGADRELLDRSGQGRGIRGDHRSGRLSLRAAREAEHREPGRRNNQLGCRRDQQCAGCRCHFRRAVLARRHVTVDPAPPTVIKLTGITTRFGQHVVHRDLELSVVQGEILCIVGGSGSGKTTLLRQMLGLDRPTEGRIEVLGQSALGARVGAAERAQAPLGRLVPTGRVVFRADRCRERRFAIAGAAHVR